jgi:hypothetical protein
LEPLTKEQHSALHTHTRPTHLSTEAVREQLRTKRERPYDTWEDAVAAQTQPDRREQAAAEVDASLNAAKIERERQEELEALDGRTYDPTTVVPFDITEDWYRLLRRANYLEGVIKTHASHLWNDVERLLEKRGL